MKLPNVPIRYQIVALVVLLLVGAISAHLVYANQLVREDKLAYVQELNASLAHTKSEEVRAALEATLARLGFLTETYASSELGPATARRASWIACASQRSTRVRSASIRASS